MLQRPVDRSGRPLPWYTFSAIHFLSTLPLASLRILEFGGGYSTFWWGRKASTVTTVEEDPKWYEFILKRTQLLEGVFSILHNINEAPGVFEGEAFDVVVIDGGDRYECAKLAIQLLSPNGLVVLDNSDGFWGPEGTYPIIDLFNDEEFARIDFYGLAPGTWGMHCTSVFFKSDNMLRGLPPPKREGSLLGHTPIGR